ncbi:hypothetical protein OESDEN_06899 [Oesophagostomum dentatum]|uniref:Uncharacterized protein n=1 Tax=Oesophagostomum dentatum TaxID=61180 RepID=A0A0B1T6N0_OESDE|nr:hypothetical protein OESDEN_06899 [Oesophagostomum dentatum]
MYLFADSVETDPDGNNLCFLLFGFNTTADPSGQLFDIDAPPTGFHQVLSILDQFIAAANPFQLPFSALLEPAFRLLQRLVSVDCLYSPAVLRFIRSMNLIQQLVQSPFLSTPLSQNPNDGPTLLSVTRMISGSILHLTALEVSALLKSGHFAQPQEIYSTLLEPSEVVINHEETVEGGVNSLLLSLLRHGHIDVTEEIEYPRLVHFNAHKLHALNMISNTLHALLTREIVSTQAEDTSPVTREMEAVLTYGTDINAQLLQRGASEQLVSGCTALLNVMALFAPVPFFSLAVQLNFLTDTTFLLIEYLSGCGAEEQVAVCGTLLRLCKTICELAKEEYSERGASEQLVSGCTALLNVMALFAPVPFFSLAVQLNFLTDTTFLLIEYLSGCGAEEQVAVCGTLLRLCKTICELAKEEYSEH